jgi:hypothetical protein
MLSFKFNSFHQKEGMQMGLLRSIVDGVGRLFGFSNRDAINPSNPTVESPVNAAHSQPKPVVDLKQTLPTDLERSAVTAETQPVIISEDPPAPLEALTEPLDHVASEEPAAVTGESADLSMASSNPSFQEQPPEPPETPVVDEIVEPSFAGALCLYEVDPNSGHGTFRVVSKDRSILYEQPLSSGVYNNWISESGRAAAIQTVMGQGADSNRLMLIDVDRGAVVFSVTPETRWADDYAFDEETGRLSVILDAVGTFTYDAQGRCLDQHYFDDPALNSTRFSEIIPAAEVLLVENNPAKAEIALKLAIKARSLGADKDSRWNPAALKVQGLAYDQLGLYQEALDCLVKATEINPRLGVKRKIESLNNKLKTMSK